MHELDERQLRLNDARAALFARYVGPDDAVGMSQVLSHILRPPGKKQENSYALLPFGPFGKHVRQPPSSGRHAAGPCLHPKWQVLCLPWS